MDGASGGRRHVENLALHSIKDTYCPPPPTRRHTFSHISLCAVGEGGLVAYRYQLVTVA